VHNLISKKLVLNAQESRLERASVQQQPQSVEKKEKEKKPCLEESRVARACVPPFRQQPQRETQRMVLIKNFQNQLYGHVV